MAHRTYTKAAPVAVGRRDSCLSYVSAGTVCAGAGRDPFGNIDSHKLITYTAKTELVYRFN